MGKYQINLLQKFHSMPEKIRLTSIQKNSCFKFRNCVVPSTVKSEIYASFCLSQMLKRVQHDSVLSFRTRFGIYAFILQFYFAVGALHGIDTKPMIPFFALSDTLPVFDFSFVFNLFNEKIEKRMPTN